MEIKMDKKQRKEYQELAMDIMKKRGIDYDDWLDKLHYDVVTSDIQILRKALKSMYNKSPDTSQTYSSNHD